MNILISFSGGRTSAYMAKLVLENVFFKDYNKVVVFANTGKELEKTLEFVDKCDKEFNLNVVWVEADVVHEKGKGTNYKVVDFETASRSGQPFEEVIKKYGLPSKLYRHCTRELKEVPIHKFAKDFFGSNKYLTAIGIRADEKHRVGKDAHKIYPLNEAGISEQNIREWWDKQSFDLQIKDYEGNCDGCFLKSIRKKMTINKEDPKVFEWWAKMENKYNAERQPMFDVYRDMPITKLIELSKMPFKTAKDKHELRLMQSSLFEVDMDYEDDCFCKAV
jgi:hypothetical protein|tara:strand:- start:40 stop:870 length:831 start_codon:yes stop_codon:yes gene_type:complete